LRTVKRIEIEVEGVKDLALVDSSDSVWLVVPLRWWDLATLAWWLFCPIDRKAVVTLTTAQGVKVTSRAVRVASKYVRVRGLA
jgi:hypothetical protein